MGSIVNFPNVSPFLIACFQGRSKPNNPDDFLRDFCVEVGFLRANGLKVGRNQVSKQFDIRSFTCDSPARAFVTGVISHTGKHCCPKCVCSSRYIKGRVSFSTTVGLSRSDDSFRNRRDREHHRLEYRDKEILLESANFNMVSQFPLEPMHLVDLGITKKILKLLISKGNINIMNEKLRFLAKFVPSEFGRIVRDFNEINNWKSTEFRQFLLYTGIFVLKDCINENLYYNFLLLHVGIRILSYEQLDEHKVNVAEKIVHEFVYLFSNLHGEHLISFNVHGLLHLADCVRRFGAIDSFSAYKFENYMQT
ncbi:uncharacterized protein LOC128919990 isoform X1 [Zeugodacus cucurbitae]|uniref:uncharacterized protein LOC128919990 isoform X1 n=1 Tax=Zeugodacus cucurbitae TaxID=28588 RepID=UPI0023D9345A|nr:uncharacterized protein LOC128919990 isoform X1 [Zeugodacus cucurbitae]